MLGRERFDPRSRPTRRDRGDPGDTREQRRALATFAIGIACFVMISALSFYQATSERASLSLIRGAVAATTELDLLIDEQWPALRESAAADLEEGEEGSYVLTGYPIEIPFTADEVLALDIQEARERILNTTAARVYFDGLDAFAVNGEPGGGFLSIEGFIQEVINLYSPGIHRAAGVTAVIGLVVLVGAAAGLVLTSTAYGVLRTAGLSAGLAGLIGLAAVFAVEFFVSVISGSDALYEEFGELFSTSLDVPRRNFFILLLLAATLWALGTVGGLLGRAPGLRVPAVAAEGDTVPLRGRLPTQPRTRTPVGVAETPVVAGGAAARSARARPEAAVVVQAVAAADPPAEETRGGEAEADVATPDEGAKAERADEWNTEAVAPNEPNNVEGAAQA